MKGAKKPYTSMNGEELMIFYQEGDIEAFNCLYGKYKSLVYGYLHKRVGRPTDVDEIFQDVFLRLHNSRSRYKSDLPFEPWLFTVLRNSLIDYYRKHKKGYHNMSLDGLETIPSALQVEDKYQFDGLLPSDVDLSNSQRRAIELRYGKDFSFDEIADTLGTSSSNARQLVCRALKRLRKFVKPEGTI
jgi:RNA polymerase sigma factor (sigma-70 family)